MFKVQFCVFAWLLLGLEIYGYESVTNYQAKVYDYAPAKDITPNEIILRNIQYIEEEINKAGNVDILVFPEYGITGTQVLSQNNTEQFAIEIPKVDPDVRLCSKTDIHKAIKNLACVLATSNIGSKHLVVNFLEKDGSVIYNTNVVFDNTGAIIAKYRKINLNELEIRSKLKAGSEAVTFTTSFGITFGLITSDDILYKNPAQDILSERNVTDVIYTSAWQSEVPFYTTVGLQHGYAKKNGINLLTASISNPENSQGGSGFFIPDTNAPDLMFIPKVPGNQPKTLKITVLNSRQPQLACNELIEPRKFIGSLPTIESYKTKEMSDVDKYTIRSLLKTENSNNRYEEEICKEEVCCKFTVEFDKSVFDIRPSYKFVVSQKACGIIACDSDDDTSNCGSRDSELNRATFNKIKIQARFPGREANQYLPVSSGLDLNRITFKYCETAEEIQMETGMVSGLVHLGVIGSASSANGLFSFGLLTIVGFVFAMFRSY